jgi:hypothetical protein
MAMMMMMMMAYRGGRGRRRQSSVRANGKETGPLDPPTHVTKT